jgi:hypothetical protein
MWFPGGWVICGDHLLGLQIHSGEVGLSWEISCVLVIWVQYVAESSPVCSTVLCFFQDKEGEKRGEWCLKPLVACPEADKRLCWSQLLTHGSALYYSSSTSFKSWVYFLLLIFVSSFYIPYKHSFSLM